MGAVICRMQEPWLGQAWGTQEPLLGVPGGCRSHGRGGFGGPGSCGWGNVQHAGPTAGEICGVCGRGGCGGRRTCSWGGFWGCGGHGAGRVHRAGAMAHQGVGQVGWTRVNLVKKLLEKASGVTLVLKKIPLDLPSSSPSPRQQVGDPSAPSTAPVPHWEPGRDAQSRASPTTLMVPEALGDHGEMRAGPAAPSAAPGSVFRRCRSPRPQEQRVPGQPRVPDLQVSPVPVP